MAVSGTFGDVNALPVTGKDGKTQWIFKLEDLKEVVNTEVYEVIEKIVQAEKEAIEDEIYYGDVDESERRSDGNYQLLISTRQALGEVLRGLEFDSSRLNRKRLIKQIQPIYDEIDKNT